MLSTKGAELSTSTADHTDSGGLSLWPHADEQRERSTSLLRRMKSWRNILDQAQQFFRVYAHAHADIGRAAELLVVAASGDSQSTAGGPSPMAGTVECVANFGRWHTSHGESVIHNVYDGLHAARRQHQTEYKEYKRRVWRLLNKLQAERHHTLRLLEHYSNALASTAATSSPTAEDPWLSKRLVDLQLAGASERETNLLTELKETLDDIDAYETRLVVVLQSLLHALTVNVGGYAQAVQQSIGNLIACSTTWHRQPDTDDIFASSSYNLTGQQEHDEHNELIEMQGVLERQGTIKKSNFHPALFVLTQHGFLHCFSIPRHTTNIGDAASADPARLRFTFNLGLPRVSICRSVVNVNCIEITTAASKSSALSHLFSGGRGRGQLHGKGRGAVKKCVIRTESAEHLNAWLAALSQHLASNRDPPVASLSPVP